MKPLFYLCLALLAFILTAQAQETPPQLTWWHSYSSEIDDHSNMLIKTPEGGYAILGQKYSCESSDIELVLTDSLGNLINYGWYYT